MSLKSLPAFGVMVAMNLRCRHAGVQICETWPGRLKSGKIIRPRLPEHSWNSRVVGIGRAMSLMVAQQFFSNDDLQACTSQLSAAKTLWNRGPHRSRRLRLKAKVLFYRALGRRAISAVRELRRQIRSG